MENRNLEHTRQELASRLVQREVICCVSTLISGMAELANHVPYRLLRDAFCTDTDEIMNLCQRPDYEEAARQFIMDDADLDELESIADEHGYWSDVIDDANVPVTFASEPDEDGDVLWGFTGAKAEYGDEDDALEAAVDSVMPAIREGVWTLVSETSDAYEQVCTEFNLDPEMLEAYEHWVVSDWLAERLSARGYIIGDFAGLTIWGRCCTGQSISLDCVIQDIAMELWGDEVREVQA